MAEGLASYSKLEELIGKFECSEKRKKELIDKLICTRNYIKFKFRNSLALKSPLITVVILLYPTMVQNII
jgi:hypothetical protein